MPPVDDEHRHILNQIATTRDALNHAANLTDAALNWARRLEWEACRNQLNAAAREIEGAQHARVAARDMVVRRLRRRQP